MVNRTRMNRKAASAFLLDAVVLRSRTSYVQMAGGADTNLDLIKGVCVYVYNTYGGLVGRYSTGQQRFW